MDHILVVDDDEEIRDLILDYFSSFYMVTLAKNGVEGLEVFKKYQDSHPFHLILTDVLMPELDGIEFANEIRKISPSLPIVAITGAGDLDEEAIKVFNKLFTKPINFREVYYEIGNFLQAV